MSDEITSDPGPGPTPEAVGDDAARRFAAAAATLGVPVSRLAELEATHGRIGIVVREGGTRAAVVRRPTRKEYKRFRSNASNPAKAADSLEALFTATCVLPTGIHAIDALLERWVAAPEAAREVFKRLSGRCGHVVEDKGRAAALLKIDVEVLLDLEHRYEQIAVVASDDEGEWAAVLRPPSRKEYKLFRANANDARKTADSQEGLFLATCVRPEGVPAAEALLELWPGIPEACADAGAFQSLSGMTGIEEGKA